MTASEEDSCAVARFANSLEWWILNKRLTLLTRHPHSEKYLRVSTQHATRLELMRFAQSAHDGLAGSLLKRRKLALVSSAALGEDRAGANRM